jgi:uncharacterized protein (DUF433 family)
MKTVLDWLREMGAAPSPRRREAQAGAQRCKRVDPLFELPRRFGVYGCLEEVEGESYAVYSFSVKGMRARYRLLYSPAVLRWVERRRENDVARRYDALPQKLVDAALELASKHSVEIVRECEYPGHCVSRLVVDGVRIDNRWICERVGTDTCIKRILEYVAEKRAEAATV